MQKGKNHNEVLIKQLIQEYKTTSVTAGPPSLVLPQGQFYITNTSFIPAT